MEGVAVVEGKEPIIIGYGYFASVGLTQDLLKRVPKASKFVVITDTHLHGLYSSLLLETFSEQRLGPGKQVFFKVIEPGELSKSRSTKETIEDWMFERGCNRDTCVIAFGGGVIGDLSGFVASTYMRGVPFVQVPTTLLAMVDSSIGGKTGVNAPAGKNLVGAFYHPQAVYIDLAFLRSLPQREFSNGMAEIIKTAAIADVELFETLERNVDAVLNQKEPNLLKEIVTRSAAIKAKVVMQDAREDGIRCILNYGHTIGHAIEALLAPKMLHGECVAIGMIVEAQISNKMGHLFDSSIIGRLECCLQEYNLPIAIPKNLDPNDLLQKMAIDKKNAKGKIRSVILKAIGDVFHYPVEVDKEIIRQLLLPFISVIPRVINGDITVPGSKSISNRVLTLAALATGECRIRGLLHADDTHVMLSALQKMGLKFRWEENGRVLAVAGSGGQLHPPNPQVPLFLGNAGTASRFLTTVCTVIPGTTILTGIPRLKQRPIKDLVDALLENGCDIRYLEKPGCFPLEIVVGDPRENRKGNGYLFGETIHLSAKLSSQYVSSILLGAPYARNPVDLRIKGETVSQPYIDMTIKVMKVFGVDVVDKTQGDNHAYYIPKGAYRNPLEYTVESDASSASYPLAMGAITGGTVTVNNIGRNSLQGDANFYTVLESMGCTVRQTETSTTVTGPADGVLRGIRIDMSSMTDTFMTVAVLAAVAKGTTSIYNIANQRLKESNRIAAMVTELAKCGVTARELEDGIEIEGKDRKELHGGRIHCYDDHRIAMSFAVLGCVVPGIVILDKECVNKTYPEFWTDLEKYFKVQLHTPPELETSDQSSEITPEDKKSIIIVGMRGSGKSKMGHSLADRLKWKFIDLDHAFTEIVGEPIKEFVDKHGWPAFRVKEEEILKNVVNAHMTETVISTGGGIVETEGARKFLQQLHPKVIVIQISRPINDVIAYLSSDSTRAVLPLDTASLWERREPLYHACSKYEFCIGEGETDWEATEEDFFYFVDTNIQHPERTDIKPDKDSYFLSLTNKNMKDAIPLLDKLSEGVDALELRVDLLESQDAYFVRNQIALLRRHTKLPIVYTVRSDGQGGRFIKGNREETEREMFSLLHLAVRLGCEYVDMEACWSESARVQLVENKLKSKVIASFHCFHEKPTLESIRGWFEKCMEVGFEENVVQKIGMGKDKEKEKEKEKETEGGKAKVHKKPSVDVVKVVVFAFSPDDVSLLRRVTEDMNLTGVVPVISLAAGEKGRLSRVLNRYMTPVTHPLLTSAAAPGQLSVREIEGFRSALGL